MTLTAPEPVLALADELEVGHLPLYGHLSLRERLPRLSYGKAVLAKGEGRLGHLPYDGALFVVISRAGDGHRVPGFEKVRKATLVFEGAKVDVIKDIIPTTAGPGRCLHLFDNGIITAVKSSGITIILCGQVCRLIIGAGVQ